MVKQPTRHKIRKGKSRKRKTLGVRARKRRKLKRISKTRKRKPPYDPARRPIRLYQCTATSIPSTFYEKPSEGAHSLEIHFQTTLAGDIHQNRQRLADLAVEQYQHKAKQLYGIDFSPDQIKIRFEIEELAFEASPDVTVDILQMTYAGKEVRAQRFPTETIRVEREVGSEQEFRIHRDNLVNSYARGYRDGSIAAGYTTKRETARRSGHRFIDTLSHDDVWSWSERDAYDKGRSDAEEAPSVG